MMRVNLAIGSSIPLVGKPRRIHQVNCAPTAMLTVTTLLRRQRAVNSVHHTDGDFAPKFEKPLDPLVN